MINEMNIFKEINYKLYIIFLFFVFCFSKTNLTIKVTNIGTTWNTSTNPAIGCNFFD